MAKDKIVEAAVTKPTFINGVLHLPGETAYANLTELGVKEVGDKTPGLAKPGSKEAQAAPEPEPVDDPEPDA